MRLIDADNLYNKIAKRFHLKEIESSNKDDWTRGFMAGLDMAMEDIDSEPTIKEGTNNAID